MKIEILGAAGSISKNRDLVSFFLNNDLIIDCGNLRPLLRKNKFVENILLTHCHLDHVKDLAFYIDHFYINQQKTIKVFASRYTIDNLKKYIFNNKIWPDFQNIKLIDKNIPSLKFIEIEEKKIYKIGNYKVQPILVNHSIPTFGYIIEKGKKGILISGDTYSTQIIWKKINFNKSIKAIFIDVSYPCFLEKLAKIAGHYSTISLLKDIRRYLKRRVEVYIYHIKPNFEERIKQELYFLKNKYKVKFIKKGDIIFV